MDKLIDIVRFGIQAREWLNSPIGQYLITRATAEVHFATEALIDADPADEKLQVELRRKIFRAQDALRWIADAIDAGEAAAAHLDRPEE